MERNKCVVKLHDVSIYHTDGSSRSPKSDDELVLSDVNLTVNEGEMVYFIGRVGSGKSTLLNMIGGLETVTQGDIIVGPYKINELKEKQLTEYRSKFLGLIFQFHYLLKDFTALENIFLPAYMAGMKKKDALEKALELLN